MNWTGADDALGAGVASYDVYVSTDGGAFVPWLGATSVNQETFQGTPGSTYRFFSLATDYAGNREPSPAEPYAITTVTSETSPTVLQPGPEMRLARMNHYIARLPDGRVVLFGGHGQDFVSLDSIEIWRPGDAVFSLVTAPSTFDAGALVRWADGRYLMAGGSANLGVAPGYNSTQMFDPATGTVGPLGAALVRPRMNCRGALLTGGQTLIVGGWYDNASATYGEVFDPVTGKFAATGALNTPRALPVVLPAVDGKAVVAGGLGVYGSPGFFERVELYDPVANSFSVLRETLFAGESGWALNGNFERVIADQRMADGRYALQATRTTNSVAEVALALFDPNTKQFTKLVLNPPITEAVSVWPPVVAAAENAAYFLSGVNTNAGANLTFRVNRVDLATGQRAATDPLTLSEYYPGSAGAILLADGRLLVSGGTTRVDSRYNFAPVSHSFLVEGLPKGGTVSVPTLSWTHAGAALTLSWPATSSGFGLETADRVGAGSSWTPVTDPVIAVGDRRTVTIPLGGANRFYRLARP